jgi:hypothetical protein
MYGPPYIDARLEKPPRQELPVPNEATGPRAYKSSDLFRSLRTTSHNWTP